VKSVLRNFISIVGSVVLAAGMALAQAGPGPGPMHHGGPGFMGGPELGFALHQLNLSDDQRAQVKQIFANEKPNLKPLMQQEFQAHQQMLQLVTSGNFDATKASAIAAQEAQTHVQVEVEHAKIASQIYQLLNSDQKAKVADMIAKHQQRMEQHLQNQENAPPNQ
jgi:periplasmic protein CpxP/Spy